MVDRGGVRGLLVGVLVVVVGLVWVAGAAAGLPDGRVYEMVSPAAKNAADVTNMPTRVRAAADGDAVQFSSLQGFGDLQGMSLTADYLAVRDPAGGGWVTHGITPRSEPTTLPDTVEAFQPRYLGDFSTDFSRGVFFAKSPLTDAPNVAATINLYRRDDLRTPGAGVYELLTGAETLQSPDSRILGGRPAFADGSADLSHVIFESRRVLTGDASQCPTEEDLTTCPGQLYEWVDGSVRFVGLVPTLPATECGETGPACVPAPASQAGQGALMIHYTRGTISQDGSRVLFTVPTLPPAPSGRLYLRDDHGTPTTADDTTVQVNASERNTPAGEAPARFWAGSSDLSKVFFTSSEKLTDEDPNDSSDLYEYDLSQPAGQRLSRLSIDDEPMDNQGGDVIHGHNVDGVLGAASDGSYVYFTSRGQFVNGGRTTCTPAIFVCERIFVWLENTIHEVGAVNASFELSHLLGTLEALAQPKFSRVTPDGKHLVFQTQGTDELLDPPYDHGCGGGITSCYEIYVYDAGANNGQGELHCASCNPTGTAATANAYLYFDYARGASAPTTYLFRVSSDDGRYVFFDSAERLVPDDHNDLIDVYEYDTTTRQVHLISAGRGDSHALLMDVSADGHDVFFTTREQLRSTDHDQNTDLYDARIGGNPDPGPSTPTICQDTNTCRPNPTTPTTPTTPPSNSFQGAGNLLTPPIPPATYHTQPLTKKQRRQLAHTGHTHITITTSAPGTITITLRTRIHHKTHTIQTTQRTLTHGGTIHPPIHLNPTTRHQLKTHHHPTLTITTTYSQTPTPQTIKVRLLSHAGFRGVFVARVCPGGERGSRDVCTEEVSR